MKTLFLLLSILVLSVLLKATTKDGGETNDVPVKKQPPTFDFKAKLRKVVTSTVQWSAMRLVNLLLSYVVESILFVAGMIIVVLVFFKILNCCCPSNSSRRRRRHFDESKEQ